MKPPAQIPGAELSGADATASTRLEQAAQKARAGPDIPLLEWVFALIGVALITFTLGWIAWHALTRGTAPPHFALEVQSVVQLSAGYLVTVQAVNRGEQTAGDVKVEGVLSSSTGPEETAEMTFKYLPPHSPRKGGLFFSKDPRMLQLKLHAKGYEAP